MLNKEIMEEQSIAEIECQKYTLEIVESSLTTPVNNYLQEIVSSVEKEEDEQREFDGSIMILFDQQQHILYSTPSKELSSNTKLMIQLSLQFHLE
jgi:hypothetical protein